MLTYLRSLHNKPRMKTRQSLLPGSWIRCENPTSAEIQKLVDLGIDVDVIEDALDPHEVPRVEVTNDDWTYFITRLPDTDDEFNDYTTPILFALGHEQLVTVSQTSLERLWGKFIQTTNTPTTQKTRMFILMVDVIAKQYQTRVASINRQMRATTGNVQSLDAKDIAVISQYERKLNDYLDALYPTNSALERLLGGRLLKLYEEDRELVEDLSIDLEQLMARCKALLRTITNLRNSYRAVMDTRLNETIRLLTVITVGLTIPTMIAGLFGMNVTMPFGVDSSPITFWVIVVASLVAGGGLSLYFLRKK